MSEVHPKIVEFILRFESDINLVSLYAEAMVIRFESERPTAGVELEEYSCEGFEVVRVGGGYCCKVTVSMQLAYKVLYEHYRGGGYATNRSNARGVGL